MKIFLTGGGTAGSVTPLLAVAEQLKQHQLFFVGTKSGVERSLVPANLTYLAIPAGKWRRYFSWHNLLDPLRVVAAFFYSLWLMALHSPNVVVSAGSFVSVPIVWAAWWCNVPVIIHQQDLQVGLATKLMRLAATQITKAFPDILLKAEYIGNPVRNLTMQTHTLILDASVPTVLIMGGGTGAAAINNLVTAELCLLANVIHITGPGKTGLAAGMAPARYQQFALLTSTMPEALAAADLVVCRAGLGTLAELAVLKKPTIVIPIPNSQQEQNAQYFSDHGAVVLLQQTRLTGAALQLTIKNLLSDSAARAKLAEAIGKLNTTDAAAQLAKIILLYAVS